MIQCNHCSKQFIGETKRRLKDRFNEHCRPVDNPSNISKPTTVLEHFLTNDHSINDIILIPLELTKSNRDIVRKAREVYLIERGKTLEPLGINGGGGRREKKGREAGEKFKKAIKETNPTTFLDFHFTFSEA